MTQHYSDPARENVDHALPDIEVFWMNGKEAAEAWPEEYATDGPPAAGWYWWPCFPGCLPDGEPSGPFESKADALADAQAGAS